MDLHLLELARNCILENICVSQNLLMKIILSWSGSNFCYCGNTIKYQTQFLTLCTTPCVGNSAQMCGSSDGTYFSVYHNGKLFFL